MGFQERVEVHCREGREEGIERIKAEYAMHLAEI
jgi:hypothetical protein